MDLVEMRQLLQASLPQKRFKHSVAVYETALDIAKAYKLEKDLVEKIAVSALLHDCGREVATKESASKAKELGLVVDPIEEQQQILLHAKLGVYFAREKYGVQDEEILEGILYHTTGKGNMSVLAMIVFLADMIEPGRDFPGVDELRKLAYKNLEAAMLQAYKNTVKYLLKQGQLIHPSCIEGYNQLMLKGIG